MDYSPIVNQVYSLLWWLVPLAIAASLIKSAWFKGLVGEALVKLAAKIGLPRKTYHPIHNVTLPTRDGSTQIDHVFVSRYGIFVVETKNMKGWIFGSERQAQWTQKIFKKNFRFQNPLRQNYKHVKALEGLLKVVPASAFHSVVVFTGDSTFKTPMPANVTKGAGYIRYIRSFKEPVLTDEQVQVVVDRIQSGRLAPSWKTNRDHVRNLRKRAG